MKHIISPFFIFIFFVINGYAFAQASYEDGRPQASLRLEAKDQGVVFHHKEGPDQCEYHCAHLYSFQYRIDNKGEW